MSKKKKEYRGDEGPGLLALPFMLLLAPIIIVVKAVEAVVGADEKEEVKPEKPRRHG